MPAGLGSIVSDHLSMQPSLPRRLVLQSLGDLADNIWIDEEKLGP
jgi:hypothetical protein